MARVKIIPKDSIKLLCHPPIFPHIYERKNQENGHADDIYNLEILTLLHTEKKINLIKSIICSIQIF